MDAYSRIKIMFTEIIFTCYAFTVGSISVLPVLPTANVSCSTALNLGEPLIPFNLIG